jgi:hypothetical protein
MAAVREACNRREMLKSESAKLTAALKRARAKTSRSNKAVKRQHEDKLRLGVGILALCAPDEECLLQYCTTVFEDAIEREIFRTEIVNQFLSTSVEDLVCLIRPETHCQKAYYKKAAKFKTDWKVQAWIVSMNGKGAAPSWADAIKYRLQVLGAEVAASGTEIVGPGRRHNGQVSWLYRFKQKWSVKRGCPFTRDLDPLDVRRKKVGTGKCTSLVAEQNKRGRKTVLKSGPRRLVVTKCGGGNRPPVCAISATSEVHFSVPKRWPPCGNGGVTPRVLNTIPVLCWL